MDLLQKQAANRRLYLIERHEERAKAIQYILHQREHIAQLNKDKQTANQQIELLNKTILSEQENTKHMKGKHHEIEKKYHDLSKKYQQTNQDNDTLRSRLKTLQQKFDSLNAEYNTVLEQNRQYEQDQFNDKTQHNDEIKRLKYECEQEKMDSLQKDKVIEQLNEKIRSEQNQNEKIQQESTQLKHELKTIHTKYDTLQMELLQLREEKNKEPIVIIKPLSHPPAPEPAPSSIPAPTPALVPAATTTTTTRLMRSKRSAHEEDTQDNKKSKPGTPDRPAGNSGLANKPSTRKIPSKTNLDEERRPTPPTLVRDVKTKSTSILKKRPLAQSNSADSPMLTAKLGTEPTTSPVDLQPPALVSSAIQNTMSPKPSTIQRIQSFFRNTPPSNRIINQLKTSSAGIACGPSSPAPASPIAILQKSTLAMRKQTPKRRYKLRSRVNSNQ